MSPTIYLGPRPTPPPGKKLRALLHRKFSTRIRSKVEETFDPLHIDERVQSKQKETQNVASIDDERLQSKEIALVRAAIFVSYLSFAFNNDPEPEFAFVKPVNRSKTIYGCLYCGRQPTLQCRICTDSGLPLGFSSFCSSECLRKNWQHHKWAHQRSVLPTSSVSSQAKDEPEKALNALKHGWIYWRGERSFTSYGWYLYSPSTFTGSFRPYPVSPRLKVPDEIARPTPRLKEDIHICVYPVPHEKPEVNPPEIIDKMRETCRLARYVLDQAGILIKPGVSTDEIDKLVHETTICAGAYPSYLDNYGFPKSCHTCVNEVKYRGIPDARTLKEGDIVEVCVAVYLNGVHGAVSETFPVGKVDEATKKLLHCGFECLDDTIKEVKPGKRFRCTMRLVDTVLKQKGYHRRAMCGDDLGHGIGQYLYMEPKLPVRGHHTMEPGNVFYLHPVVTQGRHKVNLMLDRYGIEATNGMRSVGFSHTLLVTEKGVDVLTAGRKKYV